MSEGDRRPELKDLATRIAAARARHGGQDDGPDGGRLNRGKPGSPGLGLGMRIGVEMVVTVAVGAVLGYALDVWLGTAPLLMVVLLFLGAAAGVSNVYRVVRGLDDGVGLGRAIEAKRRGDARPDGADDRSGTDADGGR